MEAVLRKTRLEGFAWLALFLMTVLVVPRAFGAEVTATTHPKLVTVFPNGARITREGTLKLHAGSNEVIFDDLPASIVESSLHLSVEGPSGTKLYGISMRREYTPHVVEGRTRKLKAKIQGLEDQVTDLSDHINNRNTEIEILKNMVNQKPSDHSTHNKTVTEMTDSAETIGKRIALLTAQNRKDERSLRELNGQLNALRNQLSQGGSSAKEKRAAEADLELPVDGTTRFTLTYQIAGASWTPMYDLRLDTESEKANLDLCFNASVRQSTGEDWKDVALTLSTARSNQGTQVPDPTNWWLDYFSAQVQLYRNNYPMSESAPKAKMSKRSAAMYLAGKDEEMEPAEVEMAKTVEATYSMNFTVPRHRDIPSDGSDHRVNVVQENHPVDLAMVIVPRLSMGAYLQAKITYNGDQILLPGQAQLFRDGDFVGNANLQSTAPGEIIDLAFGQDDQIRVERKLVDTKSGKTGFFDPKGEKTYRWVTTLANYHSGVRSVEVQEQLPRPRQKDITVTKLELFPAPLDEDKDKPGLVRWKLDLKPKEKVKLTFAYKVDFPQGTQVSGLE